MAAELNVRFRIRANAEREHAGHDGKFAHRKSVDVVRRRGEHLVRDFRRVTAVCRNLERDDSISAVESAVAGQYGAAVVEQRQEAIGQLAGGVAHDFNNLLMVIKGYGDMVLEEVRDQHELAEQVKEICIAGERAAALTRQLLAFSRKQMLEPRVVNVNDILRNVEKMLRRLIGEDVELTVEQDSTLGNILVDPGQLEQVIMNLCVNARDAMPTGGSLSLKTSNVTIDGEYVSDHPGFAEGEFVQLRVEDTGIGMDEQTKTRIFEPFFTTKEKGKGTGLGLSTVHGIVKQSGGQINVYSELGKGTVFNIYFPRIDKQVSSSSHGGDGVATLRGTEHILLVEDELNVRTLIRKALERHGYRVSEAEHGQHALDLIDAEEGIYDLVITDVVMPRMGGVELIDRVRKLKPEMKFVLMSGYTEHALIQNGTIQEHVTFVNKPCQPQILLQKVRLTLDKGNGQ
ncbi:MAG: response regulator [Planctomycetaceae bacterium]|nr:response regulator [Planctomycetaceae bacterium]